MEDDLNKGYNRANEHLNKELHKILIGNSQVAYLHRIVFDNVELIEKRLGKLPIDARLQLIQYCEHIEYYEDAEIIMQHYLINCNVHCTQWHQPMMWLS